MMSSLALANPPTSAHLTSGILTDFSPNPFLSFSIYANLLITYSSVGFPLVTLFIMLLISLNAFPWRYLPILWTSYSISPFDKIHLMIASLSAFSGNLTANLSLNNLENGSPISLAFSHEAKIRTYAF